MNIDRGSGAELPLQDTQYMQDTVVEPRRPLPKSPLPKRSPLRKRKGLWLSGAAALAAAASLAFYVLVPERISPSEAREQAREQARERVGEQAGEQAPAQMRVGKRAEPRSQSQKGFAPAPVDCGKVRCIALTFDAGPAKDTPRLLDLLKREKVPATFFLLGKHHVMKYPETVRRMAAEGHEVANHTWTHKVLSAQDSDVVREELARTQDAIERITGRAPTLMRPPQGRTNREVSRISKELGLAQVLWSATAKDYSTTDSDLITRRILDASERDGIILLHDIYDGTVPAVPGIISALKERGYTFVTVPQLLAPATAEPGAVYKP